MTYRIALMLTSIAAPALAQTTPPPTTAAPKARQALSADVSIETVMADPAGRAVIARDLPSLAANPNYEQIKGLSLRQLQQYSGGRLTDEKVAKVDADLKALPMKM